MRCADGKRLLNSFVMVLVRPTEAHRLRRCVTWHRRHKAAGLRRYAEHGRACARGGSASGVFGAAGRIPLDSDSRPVVQSIAQAPIGCAPPSYHPAFAGLTGDRSDATQTAQRFIVTARQRIMRFGKQHRSHGQADAGHGAQNLRVIWKL